MLVKKNFLKIFVLGIVVSSLSACSKKEQSDENFAGYLTLPKGVSHSEFSRAIKTTCDESKNCNPSVGLLTFATSFDNSIGVCTFSLVAEDIILTNSHCIPYGVKNNPDFSCKGKAWIMFPSAGSYKKESFDCERLLNFSKLSDNFSKEQDYAFFKTSTKIHRPILTINTEGLKNQESYHIPRMSPIDSNGRIVGLINNTKCTVYEGTYAQGLVENDQSPIKFMSDCLIIKGNSGSPVLNKNGEVVSVIQGHINSEIVATKLRLNSYNVTLSSMNQLVIATNMSCVNPPSSVRTIGPVASQEICFDKSEKPYMSVGSNLDRNLEFNSINPLAEASGLSWSYMGISKEFARNYISLQSSEWFMPLPNCISDPSKLDQVLNKFESSTDVELPLMQIELSFNSYLQITTKEIFKPSSTSAQISLESKKTNPLELTFLMKMYFDEDITPRSIMFTKRVGLCE